MELALVVAIMPAPDLADVERRLAGIGVRGITVTKVKGYGEHANFFSRDWMTDEVKVEVFAARDKVEGITATILDSIHTGSPGDGIVAVLHVDQVFSGRTRTAAIPNWVRESS